jgi:two-component system, LuxR family, response regulator FixJ
MATNVDVFVVDDDPGVLDAAEELIRGVGLGPRCFRSSEEFLKTVSDADRGCLVLDLRLPQRDGFEVLEELRMRHSPLATIVITGHGDVPAAVRAMQLGAMTFLEKPFRPKALLAEIDRAIKLAAEAVPAPPQNDWQFTDAERKLVSGLMRGLTDAEVAEELDLSRRTVQYRKKELFDRVGVNSRREFLERLLEGTQLVKRPQPGPT